MNWLGLVSPLAIIGYGWHMVLTDLEFFLSKFSLGLSRLK